MTEVRAKSIKYVKLSGEGSDETLTGVQITKFIQECRLAIRDGPNDLIAVHCTHGFNRTGFLIVAYLVEECSYSVSKALKLFASSRPPGVFKYDYLRDLIRRYDKSGTIPPTPPLPSWSTEEEEDDTVSNVVTENDELSLHPEPVVDDPEIGRRDAAFMDGVDGVTPITDSQERVRLLNHVLQMTGWKGNDPFPGSQPVAMTFKNLAYLKKCPYKVSWIPNGTRYMMLIKDRDHIFFFDRKSDFFKVEKVSFPRRGKLNELLTDTLLDGEMVIDDDGKGGKMARYLIHDIVSYPGTQVALCDFDRRMQCIKNEIIGPRHEALKLGRISRNEESFGIRVKDFWDLVGTRKLLAPEFTQSIGHETCGLIFQPVPNPYEGGTCEMILKWKPPTLNSIDFKLKIGASIDPGCVRERVAQFWCSTGPPGRPFFQIPLKGIKNEAVRTELRNHDNQLVECVWEGGGPPIGWFKVVRTISRQPTSWSTAEKVMDSILNAVTQELLLEVIDRVVLCHQQQQIRQQQKNKLPVTASVSSPPLPDPLHDKSTLVSPPKKLKP